MPMPLIPRLPRLGPLIGAMLTAGALQAAAPLPAELRPFFAPPAEFAGQLGGYPSPLKFYDGRPVAAAADWPARRAEILKTWHNLMGPWPALLARPRISFSEKQTRIDGVVQQRVELEVVAGVFQHGFLLMPPARYAGPRPAVLVPFYAPEVSVDYDGPGPIRGQAARYYKDGSRPPPRDFALQLARRGFVTLAIGTPGDDAVQPASHGLSSQPLSVLAYIAANAHTALAQRPEVDPARIGVMGHSYGGKWAMFASCLDERFACAVWSDGGVVFDETRTAVNYQEPWYLGLDPQTKRPARGLVTPANPRTGAYKEMIARGHDLTELHALMAPRPFLVSGGSEDGPARWVALNHAVAVNRLLGHTDRVAMTNRPAHSPTDESNAQAFAFLAHFLRP
ncbi:MAG: prolyl oligopeptidase family serine peptidase [Opitutaceae bacterium]|nr:prolyl oligopeptidase family serine peptidase [Opitutaceae bacterium]